MTEGMKTEKDFGGYWLKNIRTHKGHEGEPLIQASVYKDGKRIGFYSDGDWGGPCNLMEFSKDDEKAFNDYCKTMSDWEYEPESDLIYQIIGQIDFQKWLKRQYKKGVVFKLKGSADGQYMTLGLTWKDNSKRICDYLNNKYGETYSLIFPPNFSRATGEYTKPN